MILAHLICVPAQDLALDGDHHTGPSVTVYYSPTNNICYTSVLREQLLASPSPCYCTHTTCISQIRQRLQTDLIHLFSPAFADALDNQLTKYSDLLICKIGDYNTSQ